MLVFKYFLKSEWLHYGLFTNGLETDIQNLTKAQQQYADFLISQIPANSRTILDVGSGTGKMASLLLEKGYNVDCVSPGKILTEYVRKKVGDRGRIYQTKFEDLVTDKKYDLVLFSESFQYIPMEASFNKALEILVPGGHIMIADFFRRDVEGKSPLGGGHSFSEFQETIKKLPIEIVKEQEITNETAPTIDLVNEFSSQVVFPIYSGALALAQDRYPLVAKFVKWKYKKKLEKLENKHFTGQRTGANFMKFKTYRFYLFRKK